MVVEGHKLFSILKVAFDPVVFIRYTSELVVSVEVCTLWVLFYFISMYYIYVWFIYSGIMKVLVILLGSCIVASQAKRMEICRAVYNGTEYTNDCFPSDLVVCEQINLPYYQNKRWYQRYYDLVTELSICRRVSHINCSAQNNIFNSFRFIDGKIKSYCRIT